MRPAAGVAARLQHSPRDARNRRVLRSTRAIRDGLKITTQLADGEFKATAEGPASTGPFSTKTDGCRY